MDFRPEANPKAPVVPFRSLRDRSSASAGKPLADDSLAALPKTIQGVASKVETLSIAIESFRVWTIGLTVLVGALAFIVLAERYLLP
jgi:hypothetical protein